jgi:uncharacterized membrane protein YeaQ/YmgE (transglycosylase-associated protein family)
MAKEHTNIAPSMASSSRARNNPFSGLTDEHAAHICNDMGPRNFIEFLTNHWSEFQSIFTTRGGSITRFLSSLGEDNRNALIDHAKKTSYLLSSLISSNSELALLVKGLRKKRILIRLFDIIPPKEFCDRIYQGNGRLANFFDDLVGALKDVSQLFQNQTFLNMCLQKCDVGKEDILYVFGKCSMDTDSAIRVSQHLVNNFVHYKNVILSNLPRLLCEISRQENSPLRQNLLRQIDFSETLLSEDDLIDIIPDLTMHEWIFVLEQNTEYFKTKPSFLTTLKNVTSRPAYIALSIVLFKTNPNIFSAQDLPLLLNITLRGLDQGIRHPYFDELNQDTQNLVKQGIIDLHTNVNVLDTRRAALQRQVNNCYSPMIMARNIVTCCGTEDRSGDLQRETAGVVGCCLAPCLLLGALIGAGFALLCAVVGIIPAIVGAVIECSKLAPLNAEINRVTTTYGKTPAEIRGHYATLDNDGFFASVRKSKKDSKGRSSETTLLLTSLPSSSQRSLAYS